MTQYKRPQKSHTKSEQLSLAEDLVFKNMELRENLDPDYDIAIRTLDYNRALKRGVAPAIAARMFGITLS